MKKNKINYSAPALEKGLDILELLSKSKNGLTQAEIAKKLKRSVNEIYRMLNILSQRDYIEIDKLNDNYKLTNKLLEISFNQEHLNILIQKSIPVMREVAQICNQSLHLAIYSSGRLLVIAQEDSPSKLNYGIKVGSTFDLLETSSGRVLLSFQNQEERKRRLLRRKLFINLNKNYSHSLNESKKSEKKYTTQTIHEILKKNCEVVQSLQIKGITNISVPIFDFTNNAIASMTIPFVTRINYKADLDIKKSTKILLKYSKQLSKQLGSSLK